MTRGARRARRGRGSLLSRCVRFIEALLGGGLLLSVLLVAPLRWLAPPASAMMLLDPGPLRDVRYRWVDRERISGAAPRAVIAAEDQKFLEHHADV